MVAAIECGGGQMDGEGTVQGMKGGRRRFGRESGRREGGFGPGGQGSRVLWHVAGRRQRPRVLLVCINRGG
eukprot:363940-Chlamydomonas_euryale.AAC.9